MCNLSILHKQTAASLVLTKEMNSSFNSLSDCSVLKGSSFLIIERKFTSKNCTHFFINYTDTAQTDKMAVSQSCASHPQQNHDKLLCLTFST